MFRRLGKFSAPLLGTLLLAVSAAAPASAQEFHAEISNPILRASAASGTTYDLGGKLIKCSNSAYEGTASTATSPSWALGSAYSGCSAFGFVTTISGNGCSFVLNAQSETGDFHLSCPSQGFSFTAYVFGTPVCTVRIKQAGGTPTTISNAGSGSSRDITFAATLSGLEYTEDAGGFCEVGSGSNGKMEGGSPTLKGFNGSNVQIGVWRA